MNAFAFLKPGQRLKLGGQIYDVSPPDPQGLRHLVPIGNEANVLRLDDAALLAHYNDNQLALLPPSAKPSAAPRPVESFSQGARLEALRRLGFVEACARIFALARDGLALKDSAAAMTGEQLGHHRALMVQRRKHRRQRFAQRLDQGYARIARITAWCLRREAARQAGKPSKAMASDMVSASTLRRWHRQWIAGGQMLAALMPLHHAKGRFGPRLHPDVLKIFRQEVESRWLQPERPPLTLVYQTICYQLNRMRANRELPATMALPSIQSLRRWVDANYGQHDILVARQGPRAAAARLGFVRPAPSILRPLQVVEMDHTLLDLEVADAQGQLLGRPTLTVAIDAATRMVFGFQIAMRKPSWESVMQALRMGVQEKQLDGVLVASPWPVQGIPYALKLDRGQEFLSQSMSETAGQLGIELIWCQPRQPKMKGKVERFMGNVAREFCAMFEGRTFANIQEKSDYRARSALTLEQAILAFTTWVVDVYHLSPHRGLGGSTPLSRWQALSAWKVRPSPEASDLKVLTSQVLRGGVTREGVRYLGLTYNSIQLNSVLQQLPPKHRIQWQIRFDPCDLSLVNVLHPVKAVWLDVPCLTPGLVKGLTLTMWKQVVETARNQTSKDRNVTQETLWAARNALWNQETIELVRKTSRIRLTDIASLQEMKQKQFDQTPFLPPAGPPPSSAAAMPPFLSELEQRLRQGSPV